MTANALDLFLRRIERRAFGIAQIGTNNREEALDIVQDSMMKFATKYARKPQDEWTPLFYRILQNQVKDWQRRQKVRNRWKAWLGRDDGSEDENQDPIQLIGDPAGDTPELQLSGRVALEKLQNSIAALPKRQQQVFLLRIWEGLDVAQTAKSLGISQGSVKTHLSRALAQLRSELEGHWP